MYKLNLKLKNSKGFTLIELLAVIIILGVLLLIAVPSVSKYIEDSRKNTYVTNASRYIDAARNMVNSLEMKVYDTTTTYYLPIDCIDLENGGGSPFGDIEEGYVYYGTPSTEKNSSGAIAKEDITFMRTKLDGSGDTDVYFTKENAFVMCGYEHLTKKNYEVN